MNHTLEVLHYFEIKEQYANELKMVRGAIASALPLANNHVFAVPLRGPIND